jgi:hypothetical protein
MPLKKTVVLALLLLISSACNRPKPAAPAPRASASPTEKQAVDQIFDRYTAALGGQDKIEAVNSYKIRGSFATSVAAVTGTFESWGKNPNKTLMRIEFPMGALTKGFDGETRWVQTPIGTYSEKGAQEMSEIERDAEVYRAGKLRSLYYEVKLENKARLSGRDVYVVEGKPEKGPAERLFFDTESGLLVRWDMVRKVPNRGHVFVKVHLDDYRDVDGLKIPFKVRFAFESFDFTMQLYELQHNVAIDDAIFRKPRT